MRWPHPWESNQDPLAIPLGFLRTFVKIEKPSTTPGSDGAPIDQWQQVWSGRVGILTTNSVEVYQASRFTSQVTHRVTMRWPGSVGIAAGCRVVYGARVFDVQALDNVQERNRVLHLMCLELGGAQ